MSTYPKEPRTEPDSVYEPDPTPDTEAAAEIRQAVREAVYQAAEEGSPYRNKDGQLAALLRLCAEILEFPDEPVTDRKAEARDILALEIKHFGRGWFGQPWEVKPGNPIPAWQDARLLDLRQWLAREREDSE